MKNPETAVTTKKKNRSRAGETWHRLKKNKGAMLGLAIIILLVLIALYTSIFWDYNTMIVKVNIPERVQPPSPVHPFGTDDMGRDVLIRTLYGTRYSLIIGFGATAIGLIIGVLLGAVAGYFGGIYEDIIMRATDIFASIPAILMGMVIVCVLGASLPNLLIAVGITAVPAFTRITRSMVLTIRNRSISRRLSVSAPQTLKSLSLKSSQTACHPSLSSHLLV